MVHKQLKNTILHCDQVLRYNNLQLFLNIDPSDVERHGFPEN